MANSSPFPSQSNSNVGLETTSQDYSAATSPFPVQSNTNNLSLDDFMENCLRGFSCTQFFQAILVSMPVFFDAQQALITIFTDAEPTTTTWQYCKNSTSGSRTYDDVSAKTSVISEWGLECASSVLTGLPALSFFMGCLAGGFILSSTIGDSVLGRKSLLLLSCFGMSVTALATSFSNNLWIYSSLRFITGAFRSSIVTTALVLVTEMVAKQWRSLVSIMSFCFFSVGILSLPVVAYANEGSSWRLLYLWTSVPAMIYCIAGYFIVCESPRWLFTHGRQAEAVAILRKLSSTSHDDSSNSNYFSSIPHLQQASIVDHQSSIKSLFQRKWAVHRLLGTMVLAFGAGMVYYGTSLGVGNLHFNLYLSVAFNGMLDLPAFLLTFIFLEKSNRRPIILASYIISGSCSLVCAVTSSSKLKVLEIGAEMAAIFAVGVATNLILIYSTELFPTSVRNTATSFVRQALLFGAMCSPILISAGRNKNKLFSYGVFGSVIILCSFFVISLPETKGVTLSDTLDEQEEKDQSHNT